MSSLDFEEQQLNIRYPLISASRITVEEVFDDYGILKYERRCEITGGKTNEFFYAVYDRKTLRLADDFSYEPIELCKKVLAQNAVGREKLIQQILKEYNEENAECS